jgi:23S rRNA (cytosine1962-C5)-methyltransferase
MTGSSPATHRPTYPTVALAKDVGRAIRQGHPWVYRSALVTRGTESFADGLLVAIAGREGAPLGWGFWTAEGPIAIRMMSTRIDTTRGKRPNDVVNKTIVKRLTQAMSRRLEKLDITQTNAFRWVHGEADHLPGIHVDRYDRVCVVRFDGSGARAFYSPLLPKLERALAELTPAHAIDRVIDREHPGEASLPFLVRECGLQFEIAAGGGQKGGLFLDQRDNRTLVAQHARGKRVLNLFGYTGGFSVHAAAAGARRTDTVDIAAPAIDSARRNFEHNSLPVEKHGFWAIDAFEFLENAAQSGQTWDIVICDPPSFAPRQTALGAAASAYTKLHRMSAAVVAPGGFLCAASCSSHVRRDHFLQLVQDGVTAAKRRHTVLENRGSGIDHPVIPAFPEGDYLKFVMSRLD